MTTRIQSSRRICLKKKSLSTTSKLYVKRCYFMRLTIPHLFLKKYYRIHAPQNKSIVLKLRIVTPRKPNSARRPNVKVILSNNEYLIAHIPGSGHNLKRHSESLIRGGGARDLPGVGYTCIRGKYGLSGVVGISKRRSIYGVEQKKKKKMRRNLRKVFGL